MKNIGIIFRKELGSYLYSPMAYIVTAIFLALSGTFFASYLASTNYVDTSIKGFLNAAQILTLLFAAVLTMRLVAEEKKMGTWEFLLTAPLKDSEIILGKFFGSLGVLAGMLVLTLYYPLLLVIFGDPQPLSNTAFRPRGPKVLRTARESFETPANSVCLASSSYTICFATSGVLPIADNFESIAATIELKSW